MTISVLMSTYCKEKPEYLDEAMRSIWTDQVRKPDEIILVEDGPLTDELYAVIHNWKNLIGDAFVIVEKSANQGLALALNDGIAVAKGDLIARMDSDDISLPNRFRLQEEYMNNHEDVDILGGAIQEFNDEGTLNNIRTYPATMNEVLKTMYRVAPVAHPTAMFRKSFFDSGFRYCSRYHICEDVTMWYDAAEKKRIINNLPEVILHFRRNDSMMNRRSREKAWSEFLAYNDGIKRVYGLFSYKHIFSLLRMIFRLLPSGAIRAIYNSKFRKAIAKQQG
jgi:glycosyltransferase involved in cell wall biosynthesis